MFALLLMTAGALAQLTPITPGGGLYPGGDSNEPEGVWSDEANRDTEWGSNYATATSFTITTPQQLAQFAYLVNSGNDFSGKTVTLNDGVKEIEWGGNVYQQNIYFDGDLSSHDWIPIGSPTHPFNGTFNGNGKSVVNLKNAERNTSHQGFFGYIGTSGTVQNLVLAYGCDIAGSVYVGCLAGYNEGTVQNSLVLNASLDGTGYVGSVIGKNEGAVTGCYSINCGPTLALGADASTTGVDSDGHAQCLYNLKADGTTLSSDNDFSASVGETTGVEVGNAAYYTDGIQYNYYHYFKTGATTTLTYTKPGYTATFNVSGTGASISEGNVVTIGTEKVTVSRVSETVAEWSGTGTEEDPYLICNREQMEMLASRVNSGEKYVNKFFCLNNDISYNSGSCTPIGSSEENCFSGIFDGNGHSISDIRSTNATSSYQGIFGYSNGYVRNLKAENCSFYGLAYTGIIVGYNEGNIVNCRVDNNCCVRYQNNAGQQCFGGIAGYNHYLGFIRYCVSAATVNCDTNLGSASQVGGIVGCNAIKETKGGVVEFNLYLGCLVDGTEYVGAIAGKNEGILTKNLYHHNEYDNNESNIGTYTGVQGVGTSGQLTGADEGGAKKANAVKLQEGGTFAEPYGVTISGTPTYVTENNPNNMPLSVYSDGFLFRDAYFASNNELGTAFYTAAEYIFLEATEVPDGYEATFSTKNGGSVDGNKLFVTKDGIEVEVSAHRVPDANSWLADGNRATSFSTINDSEKTITIKSAAELGLLAYNVNFCNETYEGWTVTLGTGIPLSDHTWEPIGYGLTDNGAYNGMGDESSTGFLATFDGAAMPIMNMK